MIKFIVLSTQRSGSSYLGALLNSHPRISACEEIFMPKNENDISYRTYRTASLKRRISHVLARRKLIFAYLDELVDMQGDVDAFGFKLMYGQARRYPEVVDWCKDYQVRVVHLIRRNTLKMIVSREIARKRGVYLSMRSLKPIKVVLNTKRLALELESLESMVDKYRKVFRSNCYLDVEYEQLISNCDGETNRILRFLGIEPDGPLRSKLVKTSSDSLMELVENYQHVCATLRGTPYEILLD